MIRELEEPLHALERHILYVESLAANDPELQRVGAELRDDRQQVLRALRRLQAILPGKEADPEQNEQGGDDPAA